MEKINLIGTNKASAKNAVIIDIDGTLNVFPSDKKKGGRSRDVILEDVEMHITDNGVLHLTGKQIDFDYFYSGDGPVFYEDLKAKNKYILDENKVIHPPKSKWKRFWSYKKDIYQSGWIEIAERKNFSVSTSNYRITTI